MILKFLVAAAIAVGTSSTHIYRHYIQSMPCGRRPESWWFGPHHALHHGGADRLGLFHSWRQINSYLSSALPTSDYTHAIQIIIILIIASRITWEWVPAASATMWKQGPLSNDRPVTICQLQLLWIVLWQSSLQHSKKRQPIREHSS